MEIKRVLIVEDNIFSMKMLEKLVGEINSSVVCYMASGLKEAYSILHSNPINVFLIDIILDTSNSGDLSGIELAKEIRTIDRYRFTPIIFITSIEDPRLYAYEYLHSYGYVTKPYHVESTKRLIRGALEYKGNREEDRIVCLRRDSILFPIKEEDIICIESKGHILTVFTRKEDLKFPYKTGKEMLDILDENFFVKCSRYTIVNLRYVVNIDMVNGYAELNAASNVRSIKLGRKYMRALIEKIVNAKTEELDSVALKKNAERDFD